MLVDGFFPRVAADARPRAAPGRRPARDGPALRARSGDHAPPRRVPRPARRRPPADPTPAPRGRHRRRRGAAHARAARRRRTRRCVTARTPRRRASRRSVGAERRRAPDQSAAARHWGPALRTGPAERTRGRPAHAAASGPQRRAQVEFDAGAVARSGRSREPAGSPSVRQGRYLAGWRQSGGRQAAPDAVEVRQRKHRVRAGQVLGQAAIPHPREAPRAV